MHQGVSGNFWWRPRDLPVLSPDVPTPGCFRDLDGVLGFQRYSKKIQGRSRGVPVDFRSVSGGFREVSRFCRSVAKGFRRLRCVPRGFKGFERCSIGFQWDSEALQWLKGMSGLFHEF